MIWKKILVIILISVILINSSCGTRYVNVRPDAYPFKIYNKVDDDVKDYIQVEKDYQNMYNLYIDVLRDSINGYEGQIKDYFKTYEKKYKKKIDNLDEK